MLYLKLFGRRIIKDFRHKDLLPLKLLFFIHASTLFVLYPYLTIHMRELGINVEETAIMSAVIPVVAIIMPPVAGMIADKIGNFKIMLATFSALGGLSALLLLTVPVGRITITYPKTIVTGLSCNANRETSHLSLSVYQEHFCEPAHAFKYHTSMTVESCGFVCHAIMNQNDTNAILSTQSYAIKLHNTKGDKSSTFNYKLSSEDMPVIEAPDYKKNHRTLKNNEHYQTSVRKLSRNSFYFPTKGLFNYTCVLKDANKTDAYNVTSTSDGFLDLMDDTKNYVCSFANNSSDIFTRSYKVTVSPTNMTDDDLEFRKVFDVDAIAFQTGSDTKYYNAICAPGFGQVDEHVAVNIPLVYPDSNGEAYKNIDLGSCAPRCISTLTRSELCGNSNTVEEQDMSLTFWSYLVVRVFISMIGGTAFAMFEGAVIAILREKKADYGLQRIYASIGGMISSPASGWLIDYFSRGKGYTDFRPAFYLYAGLKVASGVLMLAINLEFKVPATNVVADVMSVLKKVEIIALFISCFILGIAWGYIESFLFWLLQDLGGTRSLMGFTITVGGIAGIPLLVMSGPIIKRIGHANVIFIGFIFYGIRLIGYSLIYNPWHCLIFEAMESVTSSLSFTAAVTYAAKLSSVTTDSSIQGMLGGLYYGVGKGAGSLIGGFLMKLVGTRPTYQIFAGITIFTGIIYFLFNFFYIRKRAEKDEKEVDIPQTFVDLPAGFVEVDLTPSWNPESEMMSLEEKGMRVTKENGQINAAFDKNDNLKKTAEKCTDIKEKIDDECDNEEKADIEKEKDSGNESVSETVAPIDNKQSIKGKEDSESKLEDDKK